MLEAWRCLLDHVQALVLLLTWLLLVLLVLLLLLLLLLLGCVGGEALPAPALSNAGGHSAHCAAAAGRRASIR
jgi:hypothetical protein